MSNSFVIHPLNKGRAIVVLEKDDQHSGFDVILNATQVEAAHFLSKNPAVLAWIPAFATGELRVYTKNTKVVGQPKLVFDLELHGLSDLRDDAGQLKDSEGKAIDVPKAESGSGHWYMVECPTGSGQMHLKYCPTGQHAVCDDNSVICIPD